MSISFIFKHVIYIHATKMIPIYLTEQLNLSIIIGLVNSLRKEIHFRTKKLFFASINDHTQTKICIESEQAFFIFVVKVNV